MVSSPQIIWLEPKKVIPFLSSLFTNKDLCHKSTEDNKSLRAELSSLKLCRMQPVVTNEIRNLKPAVRQPLPSFYPASRLLLACF